MTRISIEIDCTKDFCTSHTGGKLKVCKFYDPWGNDQAYNCMAFEVDIQRNPRPERCPECKLSDGR
jgi:hypothetical protein